MYELNADFITFVVGLIVALVLWWMPGVAPLWAQVNIKRIVTLFLFLLVPLVVTLLGCYLPLPIKVAVTCATGSDTFLILMTNIGGALKIGVIALAGSIGGYAVLLRWGKDLAHPAIASLYEWGQAQAKARLSGSGNQAGLDNKG